MDLSARAMLKRVASGLVLILAVTLIGIYAVVRSGIIPVNADVAPGWLETWLARTSLDAALLHEAAKAQNPLGLTDQNLLQGIRLYAQYCVVCHGSGIGVASPSPIAQGLYQKPPQFATNGVEDDPEDVTFWIIKHGIRLTGMPSFRHSLSDQQIWTIALFLKHMNDLPPVVQLTWQHVRNWPLSFSNRGDQQ